MPDKADERDGQLRITSLYPEEERLLRFFRFELEYGEAKVTVKNGIPVFVSHTVKDVKLD